MLVTYCLKRRFVNKKEPGGCIPIITRNRCEGKGDGVAVCPDAVFSLGTLPKDQRTGVRFIGKLKGSGHTWQQALLVKPEACRACGLCVKACPEKAITLARA
jgi:4Fe-4S ferredoxin